MRCEPHGQLWGVSHTGSYSDYESDGSNGSNGNNGNNESNEKCGYKFFIVGESEVRAARAVMGCESHGQL